MQSLQTFLLDIEGTTTPVNYVFEVLFPFARDHVASFLQSQGQTPEVQADLHVLRQDYEADRAQGLDIPRWVESAESFGEVSRKLEDDFSGAVAYVQYLIRVDRKSTGLKSLQGKIWDLGYRQGILQSQLFPDVQPALQRWHAAGQSVYIFSSGSVQAQQLLFRHSQAGDLTGFLRGYFDTRIGSKRETESYQKIAAEIGISPQQILFVSDVVAELRAAQAAGMQTRFSWRSGNQSSDPEGFEKIESFDEL